MKVGRGIEGWLAIRAKELEPVKMSRFGEAWLSRRASTLRPPGRQGERKVGFCLFFFFTVKEITVCLNTNINGLVERIKLIT